jgi:hypothetical protein
MRMNEWQDTSIAREKPSREQSVTRPCRSALGANAIEWTTKSSFSQRVLMRSNTASIASGCSTSSGIRISASTSSASGRTWGSALSLR